MEGVLTLPRVLIEIRDGTVERVVADAEIRTITVDWDSGAGVPAVGLVISGVDRILASHAFDEVLGEVLAKVGSSARSD